MSKLQLIKIALLTALLVEEVRNARKPKTKILKPSDTNGNYYILGS